LKLSSKARPFTKCGNVTELPVKLQVIYAEVYALQQRHNPQLI